MYTSKSKSRSRRLGRKTTEAIRTVCEVLEERRLLSTLTWVNRDTDTTFAAQFGANAALARAAVDRAMSDWGAVIQNFNYSDGTNTLPLTITAQDLGPGARGQTSYTAIDAQGKPRSAAITVDNDGGGAGWYFDANTDDAEFTTLRTRFTADMDGSTADIYRTVVHEMGHAVGLAIQNGVALMNQLYPDPNTQTFPADPVSAGDLLCFVSTDGGTTFNATLTTSGGGHLFEGPAFGTMPTHPDDLMNAGRTVTPPPLRRELITDTDADILENAYGYTITAPSQVKTFLATQDQNGNVFVRGEPGLADVVEITSDASQMYVNINNAVRSFSLSTAVRLNIDTGDGNDTVTIAGSVTKPASISGGNGNDSLVGGAGNDTIDGGAGNDTLQGGAGNDTLQGGAGSDALDGGADVNTVKFTDRTANLTISLATNTVTGESDTIANFRHVFGGSGNDTITGDGNDNEIAGGDGDDFLLGGSGNDSVYGNEGSDSLRGNDGDDFITGGAGNDSFNGGNGQDTLRGGSGNNVLDGGTDINTVDYSDHTAAVTVDLAAGTASSGSNTDSLANFRNIIGGSGDDWLAGSTAANTINGGDGNDTIGGNSGNDSLVGDDGNDMLYGDAGNDTLSGLNGADSIDGGAGADLMYGGAGNDYFAANDGTGDTLDGGGGTDRAYKDVNDYLVSIETIL